MRVDRIYNIFLHPNFLSPMVWDVTVITAYLILTFLSVYVQLLPDWRRDGNGFPAGWTRKYSPDEIQAFSRKWAKRVSMVGLPVAILIHPVTALIFATQASRGWWNTAILPPDFIAVAVASGTALVMVIVILVLGQKHYVQHQEAMGIFTKIIAGALFVHFFFVAMDLTIHGWWGEEAAAATLGQVLSHYAPLYALEIILLLIILLYFFTKKAAANRQGLIFGSFLLFIGVFAHRLMLMYPSFNVVPLTISLPGAGSKVGISLATGKIAPGLPVFIQQWAYWPGWCELMVTLLPFGLVLFVSGFGR
jgi:molybdopterin-containing oxidoreductase family membrane subunit